MSGYDLTQVLFASHHSTYLNSGACTESMNLTVCASIREPFKVCLYLHTLWIHYFELVSSKL